MTKETMNSILSLYDRAQQDEQYRSLHTEYVRAQTDFTSFWRKLPEEESQIVSNYLLTSVALYHRLLELVFTQAKRTGSE